MITLVFPFPTYLWPAAWSWLAPVRAIVCDDYSPKGIGAFVESQIRTNSQVVGVSEDGRLVGAITFEPVNPATVLMHCLFAPDFRGVQKTGVAARMACEKVFSGGIAKIMAIIPIGNRLAIALAVRSGATVEGTLRHHTMRAGKPLDAVVVGILKEEFLRGTEFRRIDRDKIEQQHDNGDGNQHPDVHGGPVESPGVTGAVVQLDSAFSGERDNLAASPGRRNRKRSPNKLSVKRNGNSDEPLPRVKRIRSIRADRASGAANGTRKASGTGPKREQRGKHSAPAKRHRAK